MSKKNTEYPGFNDDSADRDRTLMDKLGETRDLDNLSYDEKTNSYELDVESDDPEYDHADPYDTAVKNGGDMDSTFDEANPTAVNEYDSDVSDEALVEQQDLTIDNGSIVHLDPIDEELAKTPEDDRDDLDEEGYPINDEEL